MDLVCYHMTRVRDLPAFNVHLYDDDFMICKAVAQEDGTLFAKPIEVRGLLQKHVISGSVTTWCVLHS